MSQSSDESGKSVSPPGQKVCPECGLAFEEDPGEGLCPACLLALAQQASAAEEPAAPVRFGDYDLLDKIDEGAMGVIYRARQRSFNRLVAVKMIRTERATTASDVQRFQIEAAAIGNLDHPNILPVFETGTIAGQLFFSMKLVDGETLATQIGAGRWRPEPATALDRQPAIAELMILLARAVHHAHDRGVLHRDLKPGNILLDRRGTPYLLDFGLAKFMQSDTELTHTTAVLGTLGYMAPEQAAGNTRTLTPAADVYGLGAILYALLTGHAPFVGSEAVVLLRQAIECDPTPPRHVNTAVDVGLETICLKCLEKDPRRRYATAEALAKDLECWSRDEPILARPLRPWERAARWARRHQSHTVWSATSAIILGLAIAGWVWQRQAGHEREFVNRLQQVEQLFATDQPATAVATLAQLVRRDPANRLTAERLLNALSQQSFLVPTGPPLAGDARCALWMRSGEAVLLVRRGPRGDQLSIRRRDGKPGVTLSPALPAAHTADVSADGRWVAVASKTGVRVWDVQRAVGEPVLDQASPTGHVRQVKLLPDDTLLVLAGDRITHWDLTDGGAPREFEGRTALLTQMAVTLEGNALAAATEAGAIRLWRFDTGEVLRPSAGSHKSVVRALQFSPDGGRLASAAGDGTVRLWDARSGRRLAENRHERGVHSIEFSPEGDRLVTASRDGTARLWDGFTGQPRGKLMVHPDSVNMARFSADGGHIVTAADGGMIRVWDGMSSQPVTGPAHLSESAVEVSFSPRGSAVLVLLENGRAELRVPTPQQPVWQLANMPAPPERRTLPPEEQEALSKATAGMSTLLDLSLDGAWIVVASSDHSATVIPRKEHGRSPESLRHAAPVNSACFSPDSLRVVTSSADRSFRVWDTRTGLPLTDPIVTEVPVSRVWFGAEGALVLTDGGRGWSIAQVREPAPAWLPALAEAVVGFRLNAHGAAIPLAPETFPRITADLDAIADPGPLGSWLKHFLASARNALEEQPPDLP